MITGVMAMAIDEILEALDEECRSECQNMFRHAQEEVEEILKEAEEEAARIREAKLERVRTRIKNDSSNLIYLANLKLKSEVITVRDQMIGNAFEEVSRELKDIRQRQEYKKVLRDLTEEAVSGIEGHLIVHVDPADVSAVRDCLDEKGASYDLHDDLNTIGGIVVATDDARILIDNTIEKRLAMASEKMRMQVGRELFDND